LFLTICSRNHLDMVLVETPKMSAKKRRSWHVLHAGGGPGGEKGTVLGLGVRFIV